MKLAHLLLEITRLPWTGNVHADPRQGHILGQQRLVANLESCAAMPAGQAKANLAYITHAANVLPELVDALKLLLADQQRPKSELSRAQFAFCESALNQAQTIKTIQLKGKHL